MLAKSNQGWFGRLWAALLQAFRQEPSPKPDEAQENPLGLVDCNACKGVRCILPPEPYPPDADGYVTTHLRSTWCLRCFATVTFDASGGAPVRPPPKVEWHDKCDKCGSTLELTDEIISIPGSGGFQEPKPALPVFRIGWCGSCNVRRIALTKAGYDRRLAEQAKEARSRGQLN